MAYRLEPLVCSSHSLKPVLMPHHKGRKRLHLELKEGLIRVEDMKQKMYQQFNAGLKNAWSSITEFAKLTSAAAPAALTGTAPQQSVVDAAVEEFVDIEMSEEDTPPSDPAQVDLGKMNKGRRVDYVLQERPIESFNEYLFAVASHACYWESEDTLLFIVKEIYDMGDLTDAHTELQLTEQQQQQYSWLTQATVSTLNANLQKTFSYFNSFGLPKSFSSVMTATSSAAQKPSTSSAAKSTDNQSAQS